MGYDNVSKARVMVLGTFHFQGSLDIIQNQAGDLMSEEKQHEIDAVVRKLNDFKPTKIPVEMERKQHDELNDNYQNYLNDNYALTANEIHQLGFKLGRELHLKEISAVDWMENIGNRSINEVLDWARDKQPDLYTKIMNEYIANLEVDYQGLTVMDIIRQINRPNPLDHETYMHIARIGNEAEYIGIDWVRWWYQRNLIIYKNVFDLIVSTDDRILVIIGSGHLHLINQFLSESGEVELVNPLDYLN